MNEDENQSVLLVLLSANCDQLWGTDHLLKFIKMWTLKSDQISFCMVRNEISIP